MTTEPERVKTHLPLTGDLVDVDAELERFAETERRRLQLDEQPEHWIETMAGLSFTKSERPNVTLLVGGLTMAHDYLVQGAFTGVGYNVVALDCPDYEALRVGKEFGNRAQCNPTYFTVGNLVKHLIHLRDEQGLTTQQIIDRYVFLTAGACGPCRFGMYVTEYRKALRDAGFDGFRVMLFQQQGGLDQATGDESGLELKPRFFVALLKALIAGDVINAMAYRLRPYEVEMGATDRAVARAKELCHEALAEGTSVLWALRRARRVFEGVAIDRLQSKPRVAIIGEFWAMTTEGDGNYELQRFLEAEGAECDIQLITAWLLYNIWEVRFDTASRTGLRGADGTDRGLAKLGEYDVFKRSAGLWIGERALRGWFQTFAQAIGLTGYRLPDMDQIAKLAERHYHNDLRGGEGHMEVGKLILNVLESKATMTLSVKPFGCMPSSGVSDGVQSLITELHPGAIYCAVETSGDGAVNFQSRVQMYLFKARKAAQEELDRALADTGLTLDAVRDYLREHPRLARGSYLPPHAAGSTHTAADLVREVSRRMGARSGAGFWRSLALGRKLQLSASVPAAVRRRWARGSGSPGGRPAVAE
jgi:predicted nucleotide-binding protein (sugar kinase/HSP70/actin superfamily)